MAMLALSPLLAACGSDDNLDDAPYDAVAAGDTPEPEPRPEETQERWEEAHPWMHFPPFQQPRCRSASRFSSSAIH
ncbi:hypothetical protein [Streptomyces sp. NPDC050759]|uniref:hypothetical protein n=1 Tax=Streptomyces sp. NPDC050759 TaxID=3365635 RepID=UPI0037BC03A3